LKWKLIHASRDVAAASLARDHKHLSVCRSLKHTTSLGEQKANVQWMPVDR
jgi:hypothetical protein